MQDKQQKGDGVGPRKDLVNGLRRTVIKEKGMSSVGTSEDGEESSSVHDDEDLHFITEMLSSVQAPKVFILSSITYIVMYNFPSLRFFPN